MLQVEGVTKTYEPPTGLSRVLIRSAAREPVVALRGIDFEVRSGEVVGLVGPNGAGKSTLLRICSTLLTPTSGVVRLDGTDISRHPRAARMATGLLLADDRALYWRLTGRENLRFFGVMAGMSRAAARRRADDLLDEVGLADRDRLVFGYSSGMRVRLSLARTLMADPPLIILDEPTRSLDPAASADLLRRIRALRERGRAVLLSTHRLDEVEAVGDRVLAVDEGRQVLWSDIDSLRTAEQTPTQALKGLLGAEVGP